MPCEETTAYWSKTQDIYHVCKNCTVGDNIESDKRESSVNWGNRTLCDRCKKIRAGELPR